MGWMGTKAFAQRRMKVMISDIRETECRKRWPFSERGKARAFTA